ncbi:torsin-1A-interacting protein 2 isoform X2 [Oryzias melastigma]|uniref:torsin-1A-interacting protein 2 isoform X2 n=1 Tax=Oryzias melastigma TaxID=30732 RepID=UPI000CF7FEBA|nr:torsin-1A-interacting protein 2 isoform X2 [Oryzias melastigma]
MSELCPPPDMAEERQREDGDDTCQDADENTLGGPQAPCSEITAKVRGEGVAQCQKSRPQLTDLKGGESQPVEAVEPVDLHPDEEQQREDTALSPTPANTEEDEMTGVDVAPAVKDEDDSTETEESSAEKKEEINHCETDHLGSGDGPEEKNEENSAGEADQEAAEEEEEDPQEAPVQEAQPEGALTFWMVAVGVVVLAVLLWPLLRSSPPPGVEDVRPVDVFLKQMETVKTRFPNQRAELWNRNRIHVKRHLQTLRPTEPVSLILTAGLKAERTLRCLAQSLASAFSTAVNASVLHIDGAGAARQDSDRVKLDIDRQLQGAFEGDKPVAVIHRFEELPPGSTLIFYRYCDHENAAYKKVFLIFTVLLQEEDEIPGTAGLSAVEEMVDDHLQKKFLSQDRPASFDRMDIDKYGGLWSRISHLILPVAAEERVELHGC